MNRFIIFCFLYGSISLIITDAEDLDLIGKSLLTVEVNDEELSYLTMNSKR